MIKKLSIAALLGASMLAAAPASAVVFDLGVISVPPTYIAALNNTNAAAGVNTDEFRFTLTGNMAVSNSGLQTTRLPATGSPVISNLDFTNVRLLSGTGLGGSVISTYALTPEDGNGQETATLGTRILSAGSYTIAVTYNNTNPPAGYQGNLVLAAVPEPATWGMMILGFGLIGAASRRSRKVTTVLA